MAKRTVQVFQVDAFTKQVFTGNPAGVVLGAEVLADEEMQAIARELANSDTAFVLPSSGPDHDLHVRFFTPVREAGFVGHATVATFAALLAVGRAEPGHVRQKSRAGVFDVEIAGGVDDPRIAVTQPAPRFSAPIDDASRGKLLDILGLDSGALDPKCPPVVATGNSNRLLIGLRSAEQLAQLHPDLEGLKRLTPHLGAEGFLVFVRDAHGPGTTESRMFSPALGIPEDPVSGNAHGKLGAYLVSQGLLEVEHGRASFVGHQGTSMHRPGEVGIEVAVKDGKPVAVKMTGTARIVFRTELALG
ncbi:MAG: PhzF family phenazine biosynthesis isomerase [Steroidobacteraceae bacterium]|jgi:PhzF family phenazine biosynthesis protein|nr:PhzF family phenazine biosynthesis isomerase [Steroidobacteraceae bacterium]